MKSATLGQKIFLILFGIFVLLILLEVGLRIGEFMFFSVQEHKNKTALRNKNNYRILCLGESTTALGGAYSYPSQLEEILNKKNIGIRFSVINKGVPATNTSQILSNLEENIETYNPDMVITMMGINDNSNKILYNAYFSKSFPTKLANLKTYNFLHLLWLNILNKNKQSESKGQNKSAITAENKMDYIKQGNDYYLKKGDYAKAEEMFNKAILIDPKNEEAYFILGFSFRDQGRYAEAERSFEKVIGLKPESDRGYLQLGFIYNDQHKYAEAEKILRKALEVSPHNPAIFVAFGFCYKGQLKQMKCLKRL